MSDSFSVKRMWVDADDKAVVEILRSDGRSLRYKLLDPRTLRLERILWWMWVERRTLPVEDLSAARKEVWAAGTLADLIRQAEVKPRESLLVGGPAHGKRKLASLHEWLEVGPEGPTIYTYERVGDSELMLFTGKA